MTSMIIATGGVLPWSTYLGQFAAFGVVVPSELDDAVRALTAARKLNDEPQDPKGVLHTADGPVVITTDNVRELADAMANRHTAEGAYAAVVPHLISQAQQQVVRILRAHAEELCAGLADYFDREIGPIYLEAAEHFTHTATPESIRDKGVQAMTAWARVTEADRQVGQIEALRHVVGELSGNEITDRALRWTADADDVDNDALDRVRFALDNGAGARAPQLVADLGLRPRLNTIAEVVALARAAASRQAAKDAEASEQAQHGVQFARRSDGFR